MSDNTIIWVKPSDYAYATRRDTVGHYRCTPCDKIAREEHYGRECHSCRDWGGCGGSCTLSAVYCEGCGSRREMI